jgi:hypothetical protein
MSLAAQEEGLERPATTAAEAGDTLRRFGGGAYLDVAYAVSDNEPGNHAWRSKATTPLLDRLALNNAGVAIKKRRSPGSRWGFTAGVQFGQDVDNLATTNSELADVLKHLYYSYATYRTPVGGQELVLAGGLLPGHLGYESFHAVDNPTYTRIYGVDNVPYFQWGLAALYPTGGAVTAGLMVVTGWDYLTTPNSVPSYGARVHWDVSDRAWLRGNVFYGPEQEQTSLDFWRLAVEGMGEFQLGDFTLVGNAGWGREKQATVMGNPDYQWSWGALWLNWSPEDSPWSVGLRPEVFRDEDGLLTSSRQSMTAVTAAVRYQLASQHHLLQLRAEYRFDRSTGPDGGFFKGPNNILVPEQQLFMVAVNYKFNTPAR